MLPSKLEYYPHVYKTQNCVLEGNPVFDKRALDPCFVFARDCTNKQNKTVKEFGIQTIKECLQPKGLFWQLFSKKINMNAYELLYNDLARKFYIDLDLRDDEGITIDDMHKSSHEVIASFLKETFPKEQIDTNYIWFESKPSSKKSIHLIFMNITFETLEHVSYFVSLLKLYIESNDTVPCLILRKCFDFGIYTSNRMFRLPFQSKLGSDATLVPNTRYNYEDYLVGLYKDKPDITIKESCLRHKGLLEIGHKISGKNMNHEGIKTLRAIDFDILNQLSHYDDRELIDYSQYSNRIDFYLACIPNHGEGQQWNTWWAVGQTLKNIETCDFDRSLHNSFYFDRWIMWSAKSLKFSLSGCEEVWNSMKVRDDNERKYKFNFLASLAKIYHTDKFIENYENGVRVHEMFEIDYKVFDKTDRYTPKDGYCKPYNLEEYKCIVSQAPMGSGKTHQIKACLKKYNFNKILVISPRQTFSKEKFDEFSQIHKDFTYYQDPLFENPNKLVQVAKLVIQVESLQRFPDPVLANQYPFTYDLVILDEIESILYQFASPTHTNVVNAFRVFFAILQNARHIIMSDAFITRRTGELCKAVKCSKYLFETYNSPFLIKYDKNEYNPNFDHTAIIHGVINSPKSNALEKGLFVESIKKELKNGKKLCLVTASKSFINLVKQAVYDLEMSDSNMCIYTSDTGDEQIDELKNVRDTWSKEEIRIVMYTTKITVGINFDVRDIFHKIYIYGSIYCPIIRDLIQGHFRVRHTIEKEVVVLMYCFDSCQSMKGSKLSQISDYINNVNIVAQHELKLFDDELYGKEYYFNLEKLNRLEETLGHSCYYYMFLYLLKEVGYKIVENKHIEGRDHTSSLMTKSDEDPLPMDYFSDYHVSKSLSFEKIEDLNYRKTRGIASEYDKLLLDSKFFFYQKMRFDNISVKIQEKISNNNDMKDLLKKRRSQLGDLDDITLFESELYYIYRTNPKIKKYLNNLSQEIEKHKAGGNSVLSEKEQVCRLRHIYDIRNILGIKWSFSIGGQFNEEAIGVFLEYLKQNPGINALFEIKGGGCDSIGKAFTVLNGIFKYWNGTIIKRNSKMKKVEKKVIRSYKPVITIEVGNVYNVYISSLFQVLTDKDTIKHSL